MRWCRCLGEGRFGVCSMTSNMPSLCPCARVAWWRTVSTGNGGGGVTVGAEESRICRTRWKTLPSKLDLATVQV